MRLSVVAKLTLALTVGTSVVIVIYGALAVQREVKLFEQAKRKYGRLLGHSLAQQMAEHWRHGGRAVAVRHLSAFDTRNRDIAIRWVSFTDNPPVAHDPRLDQTSLSTLRAGDAVMVTRGQERGSSLSFHTYVPVPYPAADPGAVEIVETFADRAVYTNASVQWILLVLFAFVAVNATIASSLGTWLVGVPIRKMIAKTKHIAQGDYETSIDVQQNDELGQLAHAMRAMSSQMLEANRRLQEEEDVRRKTELELRHAERLTTVGKLAAGVAHELGTPLNVISGRAKRLARKLQDPAMVRDVGLIREQVERITKIIGQLLDFSRRRGPAMAPLAVDAVLQKTAELLQATVRKYEGVQLEIRPQAAGLTITADAVQLQQVLSNLVLNAAQAMPQGGRIEMGADVLLHRPAAAPTTLPDRAYVRLFVCDEGEGISPEHQDLIFDPFFTTKDVGEGTGLGLSVVYGIVKDHGGFIEARPNDGTGTCFSVYLPQPTSETLAA